MAYELIALDMDGTLLDSNKQIQASSLKAIEEAATQGKHVAICSGRAPVMLDAYRRQLPLVHYAVCCSGASLMDLHEDRILRELSLEHDLVEQATDMSLDLDIYYEVFSGRGIYLQEGIVERLSTYHMEQYAPMYREIGTPVPDIVATLHDPNIPVVKLNMHCDSRESREVLRARLRALPAEVADSEYSSIEISPLGTNKAEGLTALARLLDLTMDQVVAVGDSDNDLSMLRAAGLGVAMGNANQNARDAADVSVADCDSDGIAEAIRTYLLG